MLYKLQLCKRDVRESKTGIHASIADCMCEGQEVTALRLLVVVFSIDM